jgi:hypothetical protein
MLTTYFQAICKVQLANGLLKKKESQHESTKNQQANNESRVTIAQTNRIEALRIWLLQ